MSSRGRPAFKNLRDVNWPSFADGDVPIWDAGAEKLVGVILPPPVDISGKVNRGGDTMTGDLVMREPAGIAFRGMLPGDDNEHFRIVSAGLDVQLIGDRNIRSRAILPDGAAVVAHRTTWQGNAVTPNAAAVIHSWNYANGAGALQERMSLLSRGQLNLPILGSDGGVKIGDCLIYRRLGAAAQLTCDQEFGALANATSVRYGQNITPGAHTQGVWIGETVTPGSNNQVLIGRNTKGGTTNSGGMNIGTNSGDPLNGIESIFIGQNAGANGCDASRSICIGMNAASGFTGITESILIMSGSVVQGGAAGGLGSVILGYLPVPGGFQHVILIGRRPQAFANNQFIGGSSLGPMNDVFFGKGAQHATPTAYTIHGTDGLVGSTDILGGNLQLMGGRPTGAGAAGRVTVWTAPTSGVSGSTQRAAVERLRVDASGGVNIGGAADNVASALLELTSTTRGLLLPRMTTAQRDLIAGLVDGVLLYNTTTGKAQVRAAGAWADLH